MRLVRMRNSGSRFVGNGRFVRDGFFGELARRRRRRFIHDVLELVRDFASGFLELLNAGAEAAGEFGELFGAEQDENDGEDQDDLPSVEHSEKQYCIHKVSFVTKERLGAGYPTPATL